ncbi:hypothetical protein ACFZDJ_41240 [Streptomyces sp. NPDC007896]|uniref:hypothetical protein n=1 Tax=Streptomyces sp. NPDC007896 TaxID=3364784 RepID=UPI0036E8329B
MTSRGWRLSAVVVLAAICAAGPERPEVIRTASDLGPLPADTVRSTWYKIEASRYHIPAGGAVGKVGKDVSSKDGSENFKKSPSANRAYLQGGGSTLSLAHGSSVKFGGAVRAFGISLGAKTGYDSSHRQRSTFGNQPGKHWIWGKNGSLSSGHAGVFYSR